MKKSDLEKAIQKEEKKDIFEAFKIEELLHYSSENSRWRV